MKSILFSAIIISIFLISNIYAQDMRAEIGGNTSSNGFSVINAAGDTLFRVTGEGNIGLGKGKPEYLLDVFQKFGDVSRSIYLRAGSRPNSDGGSINLYAGDGGVNGDYIGGDVNLNGGKSNNGTGGLVRILGSTGNGSQGSGGNIDIIAGSTGQGSSTKGGTINIESGYGFGAGDINISTSNGSQYSGNITLHTARSHQGGNISLLTEAETASIQLKTGHDTYPGDIIIEPGDGTVVGGNVNITAGDGPQPGEIFIKSGTGTQAMGGGNINIISSNGYDRAGDINLISHYNLHGLDGRIKLLSGFSEEEASPISPNCGILLQTHDVRGALPPRYQGIKLITGNNTTDYNDIDITLKAGDGEIGFNVSGGNIQLTPGIASGTGSNGLVLVNGSGTYTGSWTQASDERFKKNIKPLQNSLEQIEKLKPVSYELKKDEFPDKKFSDDIQIGLIAQEVEKVIPVLVKTDSEGYKSIDYSKINVLLIDAIKEQQKSINELKREIELLKNKTETAVTSSSLSSN